MRTITIYILIAFFALACNKSNINTENINDNADFWLVPRDEVIHSFENRDGIVSIDAPVFKKTYEIDFLKDNDIVFSIKEKGIIKVYPVKIMQGHEIVNDSINDLYFCVSYCPLTRSGICFNRKISNEVTEFGVSGMLYKDNLMPYDRNTESIWSQMLGKCVNGKYSGTQFETIMMISTNWQTIKMAYPEALVLTESKLKSTGHSFNSNNARTYSAGNYFYGIVNRSKVELYSYESLTDQITGIKQSNILIGSASLNYISGFKNRGIVSYHIVQDSLPIVLADSKGNKWGMFGYALEGEQKGERLQAPYAYSASLWAWKEFYEVDKVFEF